MDNDKRTDEQVITDELREALNPQQRMALGELELLGWSLQFIRRPLFQDPVPVVINNHNNEVGLLDSDGKISVDRNNDIRSGGKPGDGGPAACGGTGTADTREEKRRGEAPVPDNLEEYLNDEQLQTLRQLRSFGWDLKFVRRPLFQQPVAVITNGTGDRIGILGADGRLDLEHNIGIRNGETGKPGEKDTGTAPRR